MLLDRAFDLQGSYRSGVATVAGCLTAGALLLLLLPGYRRPTDAPETTPRA